MLAHLHLKNKMFRGYFPTYISQDKRDKKFSDSRILKAAKNILTVSSKFWQKKAMEWGRPCQPFMIYSEMWALEDPAPQQSVISEFLQWRMKVQRLCFAHTLLDLFYHADICWSSFLIYRDNLKWEHLLIHDFFLLLVLIQLFIDLQLWVCSLTGKRRRK